MTRMSLFTINVILLVFMSSVCVGRKTGNVVCYFMSTTGVKLAPPEALNPNLCTHINYAFAGLNQTGHLQVQNERVDIKLNMYKRVTGLKNVNQNLKVLLSVGGASLSGGVFAGVTGNAEYRKNFVATAKLFLETYSFDGLDIDWEKPSANDTSNFVDLLREIKKEFQKYNWTLTAAVYPTPSAGYNVTEMSKYLDMFNVMCYNYYGPWSKYTGQGAPLFPSSIDSAYDKKYRNTAASVQLWIDAGAPRETIIVGMPFYGRMFSLADPDNHGLHAPSLGAGKPATLTYKQICSNHMIANWTKVWDDEQMNPYKYYENQWLGYEDKDSIRAKAKYIASENLGGAMIWHIGGDDVSGECGPKQVLLHIINDETNGHKTVTNEKQNADFVILQ